MMIEQTAIWLRQLYSPVLLQICNVKRIKYDALALGKSYSEQQAAQPTSFLLSRDVAGCKAVKDHQQT